MKSIEENTSTLTVSARAELAPVLNPDHPVVARLIELQGRMSNQRFADKLSCTVSSWGRIVSGNYHAKDTSRMLEKLIVDLAAIEKSLAKDNATAASDIAGVSLIRMGMAAVDRAFNEARDRLVVVLSPTGGGKTTFVRALAVKHKGMIMVEATETWRSSYLAACHSLLRALGVESAGLPGGTRAAESMLLEMLRHSPKLIAIDEAHYFGPGTINLVKAILNHTASTVVMLSIPDLWSRMQKTAWQESEQLRSRTCAVVRVTELSRADVEMVFARAFEGALRAGRIEQDAANEMVGAIRAEANRFGLMATVSRIVAEIGADYEKKEGLTAEGVLKACAVVAALRG
jgi:type II secretory pathway predicted ATPase ExeA